MAKSEPLSNKKRSAGILLHISSLPGNFGSGDFGQIAIEFIDFLSASGQSYWQILPLSITDKQRSYSPYSSSSAFAGNPIFIDPIKLLQLGLLNKKDIAKFRIKTGKKVNFSQAEKAKSTILELAFNSFKKSSDTDLRSEFNAFLEEEKYWIEDFALFSCLRKMFPGKEWIDWPNEYRDRVPGAMRSIIEENKDFIDFIFFQQFVFRNQWLEIKSHANSKGIEIFGDIPIYVDYDSADVWSRPELFKLKTDKSMISVAGVPPDYFNDNGQLWGMPLFNWKNMEEDSFRWWIKRLKKNLEWYDLIRLDHFRAFSAYWDVPADSETAIHGKWVKGPGRKLFDVIKQEFPNMPFVAEDLGEIDQPVYSLRDRYSLPGMKVIQFGFGSKMPFEEHNPINIPYNSIAYTGTHDNNTLLGWLEQDMDKKTKKRISRFINKKLSKNSFHLDMIRECYATAAKLAIVPMQDWLGLNESARMNFPSTIKGNWEWHMNKESMDKKLVKKILSFVKTFGRY